MKMSSSLWKDSTKGEQFSSGEIQHRQKSKIYCSWRWTLGRHFVSQIQQIIDELLNTLLLIKEEPNLNTIHNIGNAAVVKTENARLYLH